MIIVSACLLGVNCKYSGGNNLRELKFDEPVVPVCPEQLGGLSTPRLPAEIIDEKVIRSDGKDVTLSFEKGAHETLRIAKLVRAKKAYLKECSPSCGVKCIYDGTFSGKKIEGSGITARLLRENGIEVIGVK